MFTRVLRGLSEITFIISIRKRPIKMAVAFQLAALWSVVIWFYTLRAGASKGVLP